MPGTASAPSSMRYTSSFGRVCPLAIDLINGVAAKPASLIMRGVWAKPLSGKHEPSGRANLGSPRLHAHQDRLSAQRCAKQQEAETSTQAGVRHAGLSHCPEQSFLRGWRLKRSKLVD